MTNGGRRKRKEMGEEEKCSEKKGKNKEKCICLFLFSLFFFFSFTSTEYSRGVTNAKTEKGKQNKKKNT